MNTQDFISHVKDITEKNGIGVVVIETRFPKFRANITKRNIEISGVNGPLSYAAAMHEIGHIIVEGPNFNPYSYISMPLDERFKMETDAWDWAKENCLEWTPDMDRLKSACLHTYAFIHPTNRKLHLTYLPVNTVNNSR